MSLLPMALQAAERAPLPDAVTRLGIAALVGRTRRRLARASAGSDADFADAMAHRTIAERPEAANAQHYELPPDFFRLWLGPRLKYSCCRYESEASSLEAAELLALEETAAHAGLADGQTILELGCGWGSLTLFMAERYPGARITAVSNSRAQRTHILREAAARGLANIEVVTADMNVFEAAGTFDRIVSVEMFEHMSDWRGLLARIRPWLARDGRLFVHVFAHRSTAYRFDAPGDWIGQYFFTGGLMPSHGLIRQFPESVVVEKEWIWSGRDYERTARGWLAKFDGNGRDIDAILEVHYGDEWRVWRRRWRLFLLATAGLFGHSAGSEWYVTHFLLKASGEI